MKRCIVCKQTKPKAEFNKDKSKKDGLEARCKPCDTAKHVLWQKQNPDKVNARSARRRMAKLNRMLKWGKLHLKPEIDNWYKRAKLATKFMGEKYEVDHIEPLQGKDVCGLHVPWNLTLLTKPENASKGNRRVETKPVASVSGADNREGEVYPELGSFSATWAGEDSDDAHHHCGADARKDTDSRPQASSGDSVGCGDNQVGTLKASFSFQSYGVSCPAVEEFIRNGGHLPDKS